jgi:NTE family protein
MRWIFDSVEHLVFSGGGVRGLAFVGAYAVLLEEFRQHGLDLYERIHTYCGSSAGALMATMGVLHCTPKQMADDCMKLDGVQLLRNMDLFSLFQEWGMHNKSDIVEFVRHVLQTYAHNPDITFRQLSQQTGGKRLIVSAARVNDSTVHYFSDATVPDLEVWRAVAASMSIPFIFSPNRIGDDVFVDGGLLANLPLDPVPLDKTLAFLLTRQLPHRIHNFRDYITRCIYMAMDCLERNQVESIPHGLRNRIVRINTGTTSSIDFRITEKHKQHLIHMGAMAVHHLFHPFTVLMIATALARQSSSLHQPLPSNSNSGNLVDETSVSSTTTTTDAAALAPKDNAHSQSGCKTDDH